MCPPCSAPRRCSCSCPRGLPRCPYHCHMAPPAISLPVPHVSSLCMLYNTTAIMSLPCTHRAISCLCCQARTRSAWPYPPHHRSPCRPLPIPVAPRLTYAGRRILPPCLQLLTLPPCLPPHKAGGSGGTTFSMPGTSGQVGRDCCSGWALGGASGQTNLDIIFSLCYALPALACLPPCLPY